MLPRDAYRPDDTDIPENCPCGEDGCQNTESIQKAFDSARHVGLMVTAAINDEIHDANLDDRETELMVGLLMSRMGAQAFFNIMEVQGTNIASYWMGYMLSQIAKIVTENTDMTLHIESAIKE